MARFQRDEARTFKFLWFIAGGTFAAVSAWAMYDDGVTRTPWAVEQKNFYAMKASERLYHQDSAGNRVYYSDAETAIKREQARQTMVLACTD